MKKNSLIYLDYNATTPVDPAVANEMLPYIQSHFGNPSSSYPFGRITKEAIDSARKQVAGLVNAKPDEIIFTGSATESNNLAIRGYLLANKNKGKHIITSAVEHPAVLEVCRHLATQGYEITWLPVNSKGLINPDDVRDALRPDTVLISIMHANNEVGAIQPIQEITSIAKQRHIALHTDAAQSAGKIEIDVSTLGVNLLTIAGHKLYAPKGIAALYIKEGTNIQNIIFGAGQEKGIRPGTENVIHIVGLGKACEIAKRDLEANRKNMLSTRDRLLNGLKENLGDRVIVNADLQKCLPNTLSVAFDKIKAHALASLIGNEVCISTGSACHADSIEISSVLKAMHIEPTVATGTVRISTGKFTTIEEVDHAVAVISEAVLKL